jgi:hypothetical protein
LDRKPGLPGFFYFCEDCLMRHSLLKPRAAGMLALAILAGCSGGSILPFLGSDAPEITRKPANATEYRCPGGTTLYVRNIEGGVWLIAPDRELRLDRKADGRYGYGRVELDIDKDRLDLIDPPSNQVNCQRVGGTAAPRL